MKNKNLPTGNSESQSLEMARRSLGQAEELPMSAEEKAEILDLIKKAKQFEANKELNKALQIYNKIKDKMRFLKLRQEMKDLPGIKPKEFWDWNIDEKEIVDLADYNNEFGQCLDALFTNDGEHKIIHYNEGETGYWEIITEFGSVLSEEAPFKSIQLSADSKHIAAINRYKSSRKSYIKISVNELPETFGQIRNNVWATSFEEVEHIKISADGQKVGVIGVQSETEGLCLWENDKLVLEDALDFSYSPDARKKAVMLWVWNSSAQKNELVILDGDEKWQPVSGSMSMLTYSPDGKKLAAIRDSKEILINDQPLATNFTIEKIIGQLVFSPDSNKIAYAVPRVPGLENALTLMENSDIKWIDASFGMIDEIVYSNDSENIGLVVSNGFEENYQIVVNGQVIDADLYDKCEHLAFSPDGKRVMFVALKDNKYKRIVKDVSKFVK